MTIKHLGGVFGRNPTFYNVTIEGQLIFEGGIDINSDLTVGGNLDVNGTITADNTLSIENSSGYGTIELGGSSGAFIDLKSPFSDDFDLRLISTGTGGEIDVASGELTIKRGGSAKLATTSTGITVTGSINNFNDSGGSVLNFQQGGSGKAWIANKSYGFHNGSGLAINTTDANPIRFGTNNAEAMRIDDSQNLLVGKTSVGISTSGIEARNDGFLAASRDSNTVANFNRQTNDGSILQFRKDNTTVGSIGTASSDMYIGTGVANLRFFDSLPSIVPATSAGASSDNAIDLGHSGGRFKDIYAANGTIQTSDRNEKQDIEELSDAERRVAVAAKGLLRKFRWISAVEEKGDEARIHFGIIAQDLQDAFTAEGLDAGRYGMFINSTWTDEETGEERSRMGVRYDQLLAFIIAAI